MADSALGGLRVLDLSQGIAGPLAAMLMADFGADVVKVEPPGGDAARRLPGFVVWNRNKRGVVLDPAAAEAEASLSRLLAGADVCVLSDAHADVASMCERYPHLVILHMPPYIPSHTPWSGEAESHGLL